MANFKTHSLFGKGMGALGYFLWKKIRKEPINLGGLLGASMGAGLIAVLPDILEPAIHPNHRALFHSLVAGVIIEEIARRKLKSPYISPNEKIFWLIFALGYGSHLFLDALTKKGLPILTK